MTPADQHWAPFAGFVVVAGCLLAPALTSQQGRPVLDEPQAVLKSAHDLSFSRSQEKRITAAGACVYCHGSHMGRRRKGNQTGENQEKGPLWNRELPVKSYEQYISSTLDATPMPDSVGRSRLCLGCHDGTIALGRTFSGPVFSDGRRAREGT